MDSLKSRSILVLLADHDFSFSNSKSAVSQYLTTLCLSLTQNGYNVVCYPCNIPNDKPTTAIGKNNFFVNSKKLLKRIFPYIYSGLLARKKIASAKIIETEILAQKSNFDLIIEFLVLGSKVGANLKNKLKVPLIIICDSPLPEQFAEMNGSKSFMKNKIIEAERKSLKEADMIICYSESMKSYINKVFSLTENIHVLPCIVWKDKLVPDKLKSKNIGFIGSFLSWHKVDVLVKAFESIAEDYPDAKLTLVGYGQEWNKIKSLVVESVYAPRIKLTGFVDDNRLSIIKSEMLIGVMPGSNWYGSPLKLFEYAEAEIAIITAKTPTICDLFSEEEVLFIDPENNLQSLCSHLRLLLDDADLRERMIEKAQTKMQTIYSKSQQLYTFNQIISKTISSGIK